MKSYERKIINDSYCDRWYGSMLPCLSIASKVLVMLDRFGGSCIYVDRRSANLVVGQKFETSE